MRAPHLRFPEEQGETRLPRAADLKPTERARNEPRCYLRGAAHLAEIERGACVGEGDRGKLGAGEEATAGPLQCVRGAAAEATGRDGHAGDG